MLQVHRSAPRGLQAPALGPRSLRCAPLRAQAQTTSTEPEAIDKARPDPPSNGKSPRRARFAASKLGTTTVEEGPQPLCRWIRPGLEAIPQICHRGTSGCMHPQQRAHFPWAHSPSLHVVVEIAGACLKWIGAHTQGGPAAQLSPMTGVPVVLNHAASYMSLPASQYSVLDARRIERIDDTSFKCYVGEASASGQGQA